MANHIVAGLPTLPVFDGVSVRHVEHFPGYAVAEDGRVFSCRNGRWGFRAEWRQMHQSTANADYRRVTFRKANTTVYKLVHRLVLETFVGPCPRGHECCHANDVRSDNRLENLRWDSHYKNVLEAITNDRFKTGEDVPASKMTEQTVRAARLMHADGISQGDIARYLGVDQSTIHHAVYRKTWKHVD